MVYEKYQILLQMDGFLSRTQNYSGVAWVTVTQAICIVLIILISMT